MVRRRKDVSRFSCFFIYVLTLLSGTQCDETFLIWQPLFSYLLCWNNWIFFNNAYLRFFVIFAIMRVRNSAIADLSWAEVIAAGLRTFFWKLKFICLYFAVLELLKSYLSSPFSFDCLSPVKCLLFLNFDFVKFVKLSSVSKSCL